MNSDFTSPSPSSSQLDAREAVARRVNGFITPQNLLTFPAYVARRFCNTPGELVRLAKLFLSIGPRRAFDRWLHYSRWHTNQTVRYRRWVAEYDTLTNADRLAIRQRCAQLTLRPLISIVMPVYNPKLCLLRSAIASVRAQLYDQWELCVADDASTDTAVRAELEHYFAIDPRVRSVFREANGHISRASNSALELAQGEFVAFLDQDDLLSEHALCLVAEEISRYPDVDLLFSDEDKITEEGVRYDPYFKPDWNLGQLLSHNMFNHLGVYRTSLVREVGAFREGFEGSQDYDLTLRCAEHTKPTSIRHLPHVLYHWRASSTSTAADPSVKGYAPQAAIRAIQSHLERQGIAATVSSTAWPLLYRVGFSMPDPPPRIALISWSSQQLSAGKSLATLVAATRYPDLEPHLIASPLPTASQTGEHAKAAWWTATEWARNVEPILHSSEATFVCFIEESFEPTNPEWLQNLVALAAQSQVAAVGLKLVTRHGTIAHSGYVANSNNKGVDVGLGIPADLPGPHGWCESLRDCSAVSGLCMVVRRSLLEAALSSLQAANSNERWDLALCRYVREQTWRVLWTPSVSLRETRSGIAAHWERLAAPVVGHTSADDAIETPYLSPNYELQQPGFRLAFPPRTRQPWKS